MVGTWQEQKVIHHDRCLLWCCLSNTLPLSFIRFPNVPAFSHICMAQARQPLSRDKEEKGAPCTHLSPSHPSSWANANFQRRSLPHHYLEWSIATQVPPKLRYRAFSLQKSSPINVELFSCTLIPFRRSYTPIWVFSSTCVSFWALLPSALRRFSASRCPKSLLAGAEVLGKGTSSCLCFSFPPPSHFGGHRGKQPLWLASRQIPALELRALITTIIFSRNRL